MFDYTCKLVLKYAPINKDIVDSLSLWIFMIDLRWKVVPTTEKCLISFKLLQTEILFISFVTSSIIVTPCICPVIWFRPIQCYSLEVGSYKIYLSTRYISSSLHKLIIWFPQYILSKSIHLFCTDKHRSNKLLNVQVFFLKT